MIDFSKYDMDLVKKQDMVCFALAEQMNRIQWESQRPFWTKILFPFYGSYPMPKKYSLIISMRDKNGTIQRNRTKKQIKKRNLLQNK